MASKGIAIVCEHWEDDSRIETARDRRAAPSSGPRPEKSSTEECCADLLMRLEQGPYHHLGFTRPLPVYIRF